VLHRRNDISVLRRQDFSAAYIGMLCA
jgi:hypothetical protein